MSSRHAFREGWGAVVAENCQSRSHPKSSTSRRATPSSTRRTIQRNVIGWENIESDQRSQVRDLARRIQKDAKTCTPRECSSRRSWRNITAMPGARSSGVARTPGLIAFELNFSCPHGSSRTQNGRGNGRGPGVVREVCRMGDGGREEAQSGQKMTPNVTRIAEPSRAALRAGCHGRVGDQHDPQRDRCGSRHACAPEPTRRRIHHPRRLFLARRCKPIALRMVMEIAQLIQKRIPRPHALRHWRDRERRAMRAQFILLGSRHRASLHRRDEIRLSIGEGYAGTQLLAFMEKHNSRRWLISKARVWTVSSRTHAELVRMQGRAKAKDKAAAESRGEESRSGRQRMERQRFCETIRSARAIRSDR